MKNPTLTLGFVFRDHVQFKQAVIMYSLVNGYGEIHFPKNEKLKVIGKCAKWCPWKCCAGKMYGSNNILIKTILDEHTCGRTWANKNMKSSLLTDLYMDRIKLNPIWPVDSFLATVESEWNHGCTKRKAYKALDKALKIIEGKHAEQYTKLWNFAEEVKKTNPGSTVNVKLDRGRNLFKRKTLKDALWSVARTATVPYFKKAMEDMKKLDEKAYDWLVKLPAYHWSMSDFETHPKCDMLLNNLCESFNVVILIPRQKPIVTMLLLIHTLLIKRIQMRKDIMVNKVGDLCLKIKKKLEEAKIQSGRCIAQWLEGSKFQVDDGGGSNMWLTWLRIPVRAESIP
ncbi:uncharacterized protein [Malus domestica]|uniref:uncharacterized protein n=1 Tax=Malus domestica TaxID=3750 RepID=UPI003974C67D